MSREGVPARSVGRDGEGDVASQPFPPHFFPVVGYHGPPHAWFPPHPSTGVPAQWSPSWGPPVAYPAPTPPWSTQPTSSTTTTTNTTANAPSDEYTVDTLRRVFKDDDGRVEIQRVKVQRRHPESGTLSGPEAMSVVPIGNFTVNERRPPPRKNRRKQQIQVTAPGPGGPYPWYPYMPYMPYPYPYPYYFGGCMWPPGAPPSSVSSWSGNDDSERVSSRQDSTLESQRLESRVSRLSRDSLPSMLHRSSSPAAASQITDSHSIAPSDSVSVRGRKRETSLERALRGPTPPPRTKSRASSSLDCKSGDVGKTQEWMLEMQRALSGGDVASDITEKTSLKTDPSGDIYKKIPPIRKRRKIRTDYMSDKSSLADLKDVDDINETQSVVSDATFDESSRLSSELNYAFRKLERSVDAFKTEIIADSPPLAASPSIDIIHSSGDTTPTTAHVDALPLSDISGIAEKAMKEEVKESTRHEHPRAMSPESVCSLPSLEATKAGSAHDDFLHFKLPVASSQTTSDTDTSTMTVTSTTLCSLTTPQVSSSSVGSPQEHKNDVFPVSSVSTETSSDTTSTSEVTLQPSQETTETSQPTETQSPGQKLSPLPMLPSVQCSSSITSGISTETGTRISEVSTEFENLPVMRTATVSNEISTANNVASTSTNTPTTGHEEANEASGSHSQASSSSTFFSTQPADGSHAFDTDSTDIPLPTPDSATADEIEESPVSPTLVDGYQWVLQRPEEAPTLNTTDPDGQDERRNAWRAEVSLWRARLVVSLCRGRGLDRQDWATFHLMVHHPLTLDLKLSLLHAPRLCAANCSTGPALMRVALIHLAQYGETLLQPEAARQHGWRTIKLDTGHAWIPVKGAVEILENLGYQEREDGSELRYRRRNGPEASVVARLTLDMLVLAEELRLYLTGTHQYPNNVSELFFPETSSQSGIQDLPQRPPSSEGSFVSAQSEAVPTARPISAESSATDEDTETLEACAVSVSSQAKASRRRSLSEIALKDNVSTPAVRADFTETNEPPKDAPLQVEARTDSYTPEGSGKSHHPLANDVTTLGSDVTSLPDLQSMHSSTTSPDSQRCLSASSGNDTVTPTATPTPTPEVNSFPVPGEDKNVTPPAPNHETPIDNPEDHVYEEIDVIRAQVQAIRASSVPTESVPPPLPPKKKISSGGEDDSGLSLTYPQVEWSSVSTPGSLRGGSTGARRKKRRAPMPPEFMPQNWKESQIKPKENEECTRHDTQNSKESDGKKKAEYRRSLNPFYEEIDSVQEQVKVLESNDATSHKDNSVTKITNGNPFFENPLKATGYIGRNPFYDDVETLKKTEEYREISTSQPTPPATMSDPICTTGSVSEPQGDAIAVRPKRRAPRPPPTPESQRVSPTSTTLNSPKDKASPVATEHMTAASVTTMPKEQNENENPKLGLEEAICQEESDTVSDGNLKTIHQQKNKPIETVMVKDITSSDNASNEAKKQPSRNNSNNEKVKPVTSLIPSTPSSEINPVAKQEQTPEIRSTAETDINDKTMNSSLSLSSKDNQQTQEMEPTRGDTTPKFNQKIQARMPLPHPKTPPPPPPPSARSPVLRDASVITLTQDSPPPVPPPKAPLSLLDEIPYMDANEVKYAKAQKLPPSPHIQILGAHDKCSAENPPLFPPSALRQPSLKLAGMCTIPFVDDSDLPPDCPPPLPPHPPPESPPETPHNSPPDTPHTSPPETPHTSPPETPHASPPVTPRLSQKQSPLAASLRHPVDSKTKTTDIAKGEAPPVPPKILQSASVSSRNTTSPPPTTQPESLPPRDASQCPPSLPPKTNQQAKASSNTHTPVMGTNSVNSSASEERYEIPDTSLAPPPRPLVPASPTAKRIQTNNKPNTQLSDSERYEIPEAPQNHGVQINKGSDQAVKTTDTEERYEIPEVVKEAPLKRGANGAPCLGVSSSSRKGEMASVFGPAKPPRRRRNNHSPPPRPPKNPALLDGTRDVHLGIVAKQPSTTSSFSSLSMGTTSSGPSPLSSQNSKKTPKRRSWPFLLCDCLYVNCRTYEDTYKN